MKNINRNFYKNIYGITLISLVITIIVLLILAGVTITMLTGENGIITQAQRAKEETEIAQEKEQIEFAIASLKLANKEMNAENLQEELNNSSENTDIKVEEMGENDFLVTFPSGRVYEVEDGNVEYVGKEGQLEDVIIKVNKESDLTEKQIQEVEVTIKTYNNPGIEKNVTLQYAWNNNKESKPNNYTNANLNGNNITRKTTISSGEQETGNYYLWLRVTVDGKTVEKTYGKYYIKKYATLIAPAVNDSNSDFLRNANIQRGKIKTITLTNSIEGKKANEGNCWDVSTTQNGEILAWYETEPAGDDTYYNVTIGADGKIRANANSQALFAYVGCNVVGEEVKIEGLENLDTSNMTNMCRMFWYCSNLKTLNLSSFDTGRVTNMGYMFSNCSNLMALNLSNFDTGNVTDMNSMFQSCSNLESLNLSNFDTGEVTDMNYMFRYCDKLKGLDLSNFETGKVNTMVEMFNGCHSLVTLKLDKFDTSNVRSMCRMFESCYDLTNLDLGNFKTNNVSNMSVMFRSCANIANLDLSNFETSNVTNMNAMFEDCKNLEKLDLRNWKFNDMITTSNMFTNISANIIVTVSSEEIKNKLMSIYPNFKDNNFQIIE